MNGKNSSGENNNNRPPEMSDSRGNVEKSADDRKERLAMRSEQELQAKIQAQAVPYSSKTNGNNQQPLDVDTRRQQRIDRKSQSSSNPGAKAVSNGIVQPEPVENTMLAAVVAMDPSEEVEAAREEERRLAAEREEALRRRLEELESGNDGNANVVVAQATNVEKVQEEHGIEEEGSGNRRIFCAVFCSLLSLGIILLALWGSGVAFKTNTDSNKLETLPSPVPTQSMQPSGQPTNKPSSQPTSRPSSQPTSCVAESTHCGLNPGSWEDFDELDCDVCCYGYHSYLRESDRENKAYCMEAPIVLDTPFYGVTSTSWCTFRSNKCGLYPDSWEDYDELDCRDCCFGYHSYLDEDNQNKAYCMQNPTATQRTWNK